jgi:hypothetical protein
MKYTATKTSFLVTLCMLPLCGTLIYHALIQPVPPHLMRGLFFVGLMLLVVITFMGFMMDVETKLSAERTEARNARRLRVSRVREANLIAYKDTSEHISVVQFVVETEEGTAKVLRIPLDEMGRLLSSEKQYVVESAEWLKNRGYSA